jgi:hypothetical protein
MKKKILGGIALLAIAAVAAWNVDFNSPTNDLSGTSLANVEALAAENGKIDTYVWCCGNGYVCGIKNGVTIVGVYRSIC